MGYRRSGGGGLHWSVWHSSSPQVPQTSGWSGVFPAGWGNLALCPGEGQRGRILADSEVTTACARKRLDGRARLLEDWIPAWREMALKSQELGTL